MEGAVRGTLSCVELRDVRRQVSTSLSAMSPFAGRFRVWMRRRARKLAQLAASARSPGGHEPLGSTVGWCSLWRHR